MEDSLQMCSRCIFDSRVPGIRFDENGVCTYCKIHDALEKVYPLNESGKRKLEILIQKIKKNGQGKKYDCIVGVSGGRDSTYTLHMAKKLGLRPLAVHFDNGWNSEIAVNNIHKAVTKLDVDLYTVVADWDEFRDLQLSFLKASVPDADIPTDWAIYSVLFDVASKEGIKYILQGHSFRTEGTSPIGWTYMDGKYVKSVHKLFGKKPITSFPIMDMKRLLYFIFLKRIKEVRLLEYFDYRKKDVDELLMKELGWEYYGGHHHESTYTHFFQSFILPKKFHIDKRKTELSAMIRSGQISRDDAIKEISCCEYPHEKEIIEYAIKKLRISHEEFEKIMNAEIKTFKDYPTYYPLIKALRFPIKIGCTLNLIPQIVYEKYFGT